MNLEALTNFAIGIVLTAALMGNLDRLNHWVTLATAKVLFESRTETWGSPYFFKKNKINLNSNKNK